MQSILDNQTAYRQEVAYRQLGVIQQNVEQIAREKGLPAAREYLTGLAKSSNVMPGVSKVVSKRISELEQRQTASQAVGMLFSKNPAERQRGIGLAFQSMPTQAAAGLMKATMPDMQAVNVNGRLFSFNPATGEAVQLANVPKEFSLGSINDKQVERELMRLAGGDIQGWQQAMTSEDPEQRSIAQGMLSRAVQSAEGKEVEKEARREARSDARVNKLTMAQERSAAMAYGREQGSTLEAGRSEKIDMARDVLRTAKNIEAAYNPDFVGPARGRLGWLGEKTGQLSPEETAFRSYTERLKDDLLRARSGAAISEKEYERMLGFLPDPTQNPGQFQTQLRIFTDQY
jgi:hypothetical protein